MAYSTSNFGIPIASVIPNTSGFTITKATPVKIAAGGMALINISNPSDIEAIIGLTMSNVVSGANGPVISQGILANIGALYGGFAIGDGIWIDATGHGLTNVAPAIGIGGFVAGMFVIKIGTVQANFNLPAQLDLVIFWENRGSL